MTIELTALALPPSADASKFADFGREVKGVNPGTLTPEQFQEIQEALYKVCRHHLRDIFLIHNHDINSTMRFSSET
jgi:xanthine dioxygenase